MSITVTYLDITKSVGCVTIVFVTVYLHLNFRAPIIYVLLKSTANILFVVCVSRKCLSSFSVDTIVAGYLT